MARKRPRIRFKLLTDRKEKGGFSVPNLKLYFEASCLCWIKDWINLENTDLLDLEGFNNRFGWHAYLWLNKEKVHNGFSNHIIRGPLYEVWERNKKTFRMENTLVVIANRHFNYQKKQIWKEKD
ncbi:Hypothetical predicted protein [Podarcis lilfordi]|uniref:Uncharacterized protein n=1 Tax=Podarcis lilfordi TaxID=74358 RepID=A0AA35QQL9_9SAUR|nr:Hypothetical predicted protein [Podarcis lilfordi]